MDQRVSEDFAEHCQALGVVQERTVEALLISALAMDAARVGQLLTTAQEWKASDGATDEEKAARVEREALEEIDLARQREERRKQDRPGGKKGSRRRA